MVVYGADAGSISKDRFCWARRSASGRWSSASSIDALAKRVDEDLTNGLPVALGFECPAYAPIPDSSERLGRARSREGSPAFSSQVGASVLVTGLVEMAWVFRHLNHGVAKPPVFLDWAAFEAHGSGLLVWEAFITGTSGTGQGSESRHCADAKLAVGAFRKKLPTPSSDLGPDDDVLSITAAALLWSGLSKDRKLLQQHSLVVRARR